MKNKKGFTLIELLAVIVILAIIMVIATMQINKTIKKAREDAFDLAFKNLKREIKQRIVTGDEYLCYDGDRKAESDISRNNQFFGNYFFGLCGNGTEEGNNNKTIDDKNQGHKVNVSDPRFDAGTKYCQDIYDISDDYHMWVKYQYISGKISLELSATSNSKFKGVKYKLDEVDTIGAINENTITSTLNNDEFTIDYIAGQGKLAGVHISTKDCNANKPPCGCEYSEEKWNQYIYNGNPSYECKYQWNKSKIDYIKGELAKYTASGKIKASKACEILTDPDNWK